VVCIVNVGKCIVGCIVIGGCIVNVINGVKLVTFGDIESNATILTNTNNKVTTFKMNHDACQQRSFAPVIEKGYLEPKQVRRGLDFMTGSRPTSMSCAIRLHSSEKLTPAQSFEVEI
jgi:hypothetical protein